MSPRPPAILSGVSSRRPHPRSAPTSAPSAPPPNQTPSRPRPAPGTPLSPSRLCRPVPSPGEMVSISTPIAVPLAPPPRVPTAAATPAPLRPRPGWRSDQSARRHCRIGGGAAGVGTCAGRGHRDGGGGAERCGKVGSAGAGPRGRDPDAAALQPVQ